MPVRPIIDVEVNDGAFKRFYDLFTSYSEKLDEMPESWRALDAAMGDTGKTLEGRSVSAKEALAIAAAQAGVLAEALKGATSAQHGLDGATTKAKKSMGGLLSNARGVAGAISTIAGGVFKIAAFGGLGALFSGLGFADLTGAAFNRSRESSGLGVSPGELAAFQVNAQQFLSTSALEAAANARIDVSKSAQLGILGIGWAAAQRMKSSDLAFEELKGARAAYLDAQKRGYSPMQMPAVTAYLNLGGSIDDVRRAAMSPLSTIIAAQNRTRADAGTLNFSRQTAQEWTDLKKTLDRAGLTIQTALIDKLGPLAPQISILAEDVAGFIRTFVNSKDFDKAVHALENGLKGVVNFVETTPWGKIGDEIKALADKLGWLVPHGNNRAPGEKGPMMWGENVLGPLMDKGDAAIHKAFVKAGLAIKGYFFDETPAEKAIKTSFGNVIRSITNAASKIGVDPLLAVSTAYQESKFNPRAVGDHGSSFGLFQLHRTGELGSMTPQQAFNAMTNARTALAEFKRVMHLSPAAQLNLFSRAVRASNPKADHDSIMALMGSPGMIAALAQRPEDPLGYARSVNEIYGNIRSAIPKTPPKRAAKTPIHVSITNATSSRVAVSLNAVAQA